MKQVNTRSFKSNLQIKTPKFQHTGVYTQGRYPYCQQRYSQNRQWNLGSCSNTGIYFGVSGGALWIDSTDKASTCGRYNSVNLQAEFPPLSC